jgi:choline dehydrogenase-like flavoprotein
MPSTIGVNPQVTIMALARVVAMKLADRLSARAAA